MDKRISLKWSLELVWWIATAVVVMAVLYPIHKANIPWHYQTWNIIFIITLLTLTRYIFLLKHTFLANHQILKFVVMLLMFPFTFILIGGLNGFMVFIEEQTWEPLTGHLLPDEKRGIEHYMWTQMLFFGAGSAVAAPAMLARLIMSIWRTHNRGTV